MFAHIGLGERKGLFGGVDRRGEEHVAREIAVKARDEDEARLRERTRDGEGLVRADAEVFLEFLLDRFRGLETAEGFFENGRRKVSSRTAEPEPSSQSAKRITTPPFLTAQAALSIVFCI